MDCTVFSEKRFKCHSLYGKHGEDCLHEELTEKRCLSLHHCKKQAEDYYGPSGMSLTLKNDYSSDGQQQQQEAPLFMSKKAICASWAEAFAYADKHLEFGEQVANHHKKARSIVSKDPSLKRECRDIAFTLAQCLRTKKLF